MRHYRLLPPPPPLLPPLGRAPLLLPERDDDPIELDFEGWAEGDVDGREEAEDPFDWLVAGVVDGLADAEVPFDWPVEGVVEGRTDAEDPFEALLDGVVEGQKHTSPSLINPPRTSWLSTEKG